LWPLRIGLFDSGGAIGLNVTTSKAIAAGVLAVLRSGDGSEASETWVNACFGSGHCIEACQDGINPRLMPHLARLTRKKDEDYLVVLA
tara:strand:+ start:224 stop:487 length:264 start_codon:yes stop_codon:yes gene_type:complete